jgi:hypothetical protein
MTNAVTYGANQPTVELIFNPEPNILMGSTTLSDSFKIVIKGADGVQAAEAGEPQVQMMAFDNSQSMNKDPKRPDLVAKREDGVTGLEVWVDNLPSNTLFCIMAFADNANIVFPEVDEGFFSSLRKNKKPRVALATPENKAAAKAAIQSLRRPSIGGTCMSSPIEKALDIAIELGYEEAHLSLISDGKNFEDNKKRLGRVLRKIVEIRRATGNILRVQPIAVGPEPSRQEMNEISAACLGEGIYHIQPGTGAAVWAETFVQITENATKKVISGMTINIKGVRQARLTNFKESNPVVRDMTDDAKAALRTIDDGDQSEYSIPTGAWDVNTVLYSFTFDVGEKPPYSDDMKVGDLEIEYKWGRRRIKVPSRPIVCAWTNNKTLTERFSQEELEARGIQGSVAAFKAGLDAMERKDETGALPHFQEAVNLTVKVGDTAYLKTLHECLYIDESYRVTGIKDDLRDPSQRSKRDGETVRRPAIAPPRTAASST